MPTEEQAAHVQASAPALIATNDLNIAQPLKYAGFWVRVAANVIDGILFGALSSAVVSIVIPLTKSNLSAQAISTIAGWCLIVFLVRKYQASPGKMAVGLHIQRVSGERVDVGRVILREIAGKLVSMMTLGIGYLMVGWTKKKQGLHDMIADTVVVENDSTKSKKGWVVLGVVFMGLIPLAIAGILAAVILASLNSAREKGIDARVDASLQVLRQGASLHRETTDNGGYLGYCASPYALSELTNVSRVVNPDGNGTTYVCNDSQNEWAVSLALPRGSYACIDTTTNLVTTISSPLASGQTSCNPTAL